ncbi:MAG: cytochrome c oxidase subunit III, partial [Hymenobacteraceae bacterium]|nr:cytochrome c oxidase subunit III [Hymenobacteraceae bacterium]MDX5396772.1 cytochrome c oxidase subunit III [Hymenobacteraceae bacterium]MDX5512835.1 cytochrome c oxidase subunit III [Hymenobacteraceae bacterium]
MNSDKKNKIGIGQKSVFSQIEKVHPIRMLLYLSMAGIGILFSVLLVAYAQASLQGENNLAVQVPRYFSVSTILLLVSSYVLSHTSRNYKKDNLIRMRRNLGITLVLGLLFIFSQLAGWQEIAASGVTYKGQASGTYIYLISALHIVHIIGG